MGSFIFHFLETKSQKAGLANTIVGVVTFYKGQTMGIFGFLGEVVTAPIKIATLPVRITENLFVDQGQERPFTDTIDTVTDKVKDSFKELDE